MVVVHGAVVNELDLEDGRVVRVDGGGQETEEVGERKSA